MKKLPQIPVVFIACAAVYGCETQRSDGEGDLDSGPVTDAGAFVDDASAEADSSEAGYPSDASEVCVRGVDGEFAPVRIGDARGLTAKNGRTFYLGRSSMSGGLCSAQYPYAVLGMQSFEYAVTKPTGDGGAPDDPPRGFLCVTSPNEPSSGAFWQTQGVAYAQTSDRVALHAVIFGGSVLAGVVGGADPNWLDSYFNPRPPAQLTWGRFPVTPPATFQPSPALNASAFDGQKLWVVGATPTGEAFSLLFEPSEPAESGATLKPTALTENRLNAFHAVAYAPSGAVALGFTSAGALGVVKITAANTVDTGFGTDGLVTAPFAKATGAGVALDAQGRIVIVASDADGASSLVRLTSAGTLDGTFGTAGVLNLPVVNPKAQHLDLAIDGSSGILVGGLVREIDGTFLRGALARVLPTGMLDTAFGNGGVASTPPYPNDGDVQKHPNRVLMSLADGPTQCSRRVVLSVLVENETGSGGYAYAFVP